MRSEVVICDSVDDCTCAVEITYDHETDIVPYITCMGEGNTAKLIMGKLEKKSVIAYQNREIAQGIIAECNVGDPVSEKIYHIVAELLASTQMCMNRKGSDEKGKD